MIFFQSPEGSDNIPNTSPQNIPGFLFIRNDILIQLWLYLQNDGFLLIFLDHFKANPFRILAGFSREPQGFELFRQIKIINKTADVPVYEA